MSNRSTLRRLGLGAGLVAVIAAHACATDAAPRAGTRNLIDAQRITAPTSAGRLAHTATRAYRDILAHSWGSHCRMLPTDSAYFDARVERCGAALGAVTGFARLLLEIEASPTILPPVPGSNRTHWLAPPPADTCWR